MDLYYIGAGITRFFSNKVAAGYTAQESGSRFGRINRIQNVCSRGS